MLWYDRCIMSIFQQPFYSFFIQSILHLIRRCFFRRNFIDHSFLLFSTSLYQTKDNKKNRLQPTCCCRCWLKISPEPSAHFSPMVPGCPMRSTPVRPYIGSGGLLLQQGSPPRGVKWEGGRCSLLALPPLSEELTLPSTDLCLPLLIQAAGLLCDPSDSP